jgi:hypothetical protein
MALFMAVLCLAIGTTVSRAGDDWKPIDPAELNAKAPVVEHDADAEAIIWEVRVQDDYDGNIPRTVLTHYVRIKIFTDRGRESQSTIEIPFRGNARIDNVAARTIKPDGKIIDVRKEDIFERTVIKLGGRKVKVKSFAMPGVEPGAIIEYRYKETRNDTLAQYLRLDLQRDIPTRLVKYYIKPVQLQDFPYGMRAQPFHGQNTPFVKERDGFLSTTMVNVPAYREEPRMPPEYETRAWMLIYYTEDKKLTPEKYWPQYAKDEYEGFKPRMKANDDVKRAAASAVGDATTPEQKLERIYEFCRTKIKNLDSVSSGLSPEHREKAKDNKTPADTLKRGEGTVSDIDTLFAAMASATGFDVKLAKMADRGDAFFQENFTDGYFLRTADIAVKVGDKWEFFDPGTPYLPFGMLRWQEEGVRAVICDPKEFTFLPTPLTPPEKSKTLRNAKLTLSEDGTIEGDVHIQYTGHEAVSMKQSYEDDSAAEREKSVSDLVKRRMSTVEISQINIQNVTEQSKPVTLDYHVKVPGYAQKTGKRLFLQPEFFEYGIGALFPNGDRKQPIYFTYPWSEDDTVTITVPEGYELDNADSPGSIAAGTVSSYDVKINFNKETRTLGYKRTFFFGGGNSILFPVTAYAQLKQLFDMIHEKDSHAITLKQATSGKQ